MWWHHGLNPFHNKVLAGETGAFQGTLALRTLNTHPCTAYKCKLAASSLSDLLTPLLFLEAERRLDSKPGLVNFTPRLGHAVTKQQSFADVTWDVHSGPSSSWGLRLWIQTQDGYWVKTLTNAAHKHSWWNVPRKEIVLLVSNSVEEARGSLLGMRHKTWEIIYFVYLLNLSWEIIILLEHMTVLRTLVLVQAQCKDGQLLWVT